MAGPPPHPDSVLMVGSIPFDTVGEVFTRVCEALPGRLHSIPDGEVGERILWVTWQASRFPTEVVRPVFGGKPLSTGEKKEYSVESILPTLYDEAAISSYATFVKLRREGVIPFNVRFQVCLPTTLAVIITFCTGEYYKEFEPLYEHHLALSIKRIVYNIPHEDLVIQFDMSLENYLLEQERGTLKTPTFDFAVEPYFSPVMPGLMERMARLVSNIPTDVPVAYHFCYGDYNHMHWMEPADTGLLVDHANQIIETVSRTHRVEWVHMPVPRSRSDEAYYAPLKNLRLGTTRLYLGLVHPGDQQATKDRIEAARRVFEHPFGVATECGLGRTPPEDVDSIFKVAKAVTEPRRNVDGGV